MTAIEWGIKNIQEAISTSPLANYEEDNFDAGMIEGLSVAVEILRDELASEKPKTCVGCYRYDEKDLTSGYYGEFSICEKSECVNNPKLKNYYERDDKND